MKETIGYPPDTEQEVMQAFWACRAPVNALCGRGLAKDEIVKLRTSGKERIMNDVKNVLYA